MIKKKKKYDDLTYSQELFFFKLWKLYLSENRAALKKNLRKQLDCNLHVILSKKSPGSERYNS